jgi:Fur family peroxide stress response transcriptional regulator
LPAARTTRQKEAILRAARASGDHPTADRVYEAVRRELPKISLGTVYRNLQRLVSEGKMTLAPVQDRSARFDPKSEPHDHFVCESCQKIYDVDRSGGMAVDLGGFERQGFRVKSHTLSVYGLCPVCTAKSPPR